MTHSNKYMHTHTYTQTEKENIQVILSLTTYDTLSYFLFSFISLKQMLIQHIK